MKLNCYIYTTSPSQFFLKDLAFVREKLMQAKGREDVVFKVKTIGAPEFSSIMTIRDGDGDTRFAWDWFERKFVDPLPDKYNAVCFHFTPYYKKKYRLSERINGTYHNNGDGVLDFWICSKDVQARGYTFSETTRLLLHELGHGDARWTGEHNDKVHHFDYNLKSIHNFHKLIDYKKWNIQKKIVNILTQVVSLYNKLVPWKL